MWCIWGCTLRQLFHEHAQLECAPIPAKFEISVKIDFEFKDIFLSGTQKLATKLKYRLISVLKGTWTLPSECYYPSSPTKFVHPNPKLLVKTLCSNILRRFLHEKCRLVPNTGSAENSCLGQVYNFF
ncbi:4998_t:CDS:2 [Ambispora leptoticha]|uniref:4998_t:CDS:1 n=1 Tax=Ambispora leptoticha TaxID=144679 RepID=A0A9N9ACC1_9GLOM|nr:4998_t:CDS:2 [Ambispora leptoticha]